MLNCKKEFTAKKGFTLAEELLVIGLLGVLSAILIPVINNVQPGENRALFRKAYANVEEIVNDMITDESIYPSDLMTTVGTYKYPSGFAYMADPTGLSASVNKFCFYFRMHLNTMSASCPYNSWGGAITEFATTTDGMVWYISYYAGKPQFVVMTPGNREYYTKIIVDVNGDKGPNCINDTYASYTEYRVVPDGKTICTSEQNPDVYAIGVSNDGSLRGTKSTIDEYDSHGVTNHIAESILSNPQDNERK